jgi:hypothetical protein
MTHWVSFKESTINLDSVQSFHKSNQQIIFQFNNNKITWNFDNSEEAQKVFTSLQKKIGVDISQTKEFTEVIEKIKAKIIEIEPLADIQIKEKRIIIVSPTFNINEFSDCKTIINKMHQLNVIEPLCEEIGYQLFTRSKTTQK